MADKPQRQAKRSGTGLSQQQQQTLLIDPTFQDLISKIQQVIIDTSQSMKQQILKFQQKQLVNFKQDLFKTQEEFINIRQERNEQVIKSNVMKEKTQVQAKFNTQMKKSIEMNTKYQEMKKQIKTMNSEENQLVLQIQYIKKKIEKEKYQGKCLDLQIIELQNVKNSQDSKKSTKIEHEMKLFTDLANKCGQKISNCHKTIQKSKESIEKPVILPQHLNLKTEKKLKQKISNIKQYIQNIPLGLNFMENKIYEAAQRKKEKKKLELTELTQQKESTQSKEESQNIIEDNSQLAQTPQSDGDSNAAKVSKQFKLPTLKNKEKRTLKMVKSTDFLFKTPTKFTKIQQKNGNFSYAAKSITQKSYERSKIDQKISLFENLPRNSELIQEILSDPQVKQYLYKLMFH